jgi:hypothetical protein
MKKLIITACLAVFGGSLFSQTCDPVDSTIMGAGNTNDVFYSLANGVVKTESNTNWHLAFTVLPTPFPNNAVYGVSIRVNSTNGENPQAGTSGVTLKRMAGNNWTNWHNLDTTGLYMNEELIDSDTSWGMGAFTKGYSSSNPFNFVFGNYNQTSHNIEGTTVYVLYNKSDDWYKKVFISKLEADTLWKFYISNLDNSDSNYVEINKHDYKDRNFAYYNVLTNTLMDREPNNKSWDLVWTKYKGMVNLGQVTVPYSVTGVLHNIGVRTAQNMGKTCPNVWLGNKTAMPETNISTIGYDWKTFNGTAYDITDTFVYFVSALDGKTYKLTFKSYAGGGLGKTVISYYNATLGINDAKINGSISLYPNPTNSAFTVNTENTVLSIHIYNMQGAEVSNINNNQSISVQDLNTGVYSVLVETDKGLFRQTIIKN